MNTKDLERVAKQVRRHILTATHAAKSGHPGTSLSTVEILTSLYFGVLRHDPKRPWWEERDRFVMSKGHGAPALYAVLAEAGYFGRELIPSLRKIGSPLQGHPHYRSLPGVEASTGSLGQGLSIAIGMALSARLQARPFHVYCLIGDGECDEGQIWEAALYAGFHRLSNLTAILDYNKFQLDDAVKKILDLEPLAQKWRAFNWEVAEVDGHDFSQLTAALKARSHRPYLVLAHTVKGKGVSFMENNNHFHGVAPTDEEFEQAMRELA